MQEIHFEKRKLCEFTFFYLYKEERRERKERSSCRGSWHTRQKMNALRFCERAATPWAGCVFSSFRSDTMCVLLWWMSTLTETIIQLRLPLFAACWRREVDRYVTRARVPIVYTACNIDVDRTIYDGKSFVIDTRFDVGIMKRNTSCFKSTHYKTYTVMNT